MSDDLFELGERIADLAARINIATYEMLTLIADFDNREGWAGQAEKLPPPPEPPLGRLSNGAARCTASTVPLKLELEALEAVA